MDQFMPYIWLIVIIVMSILEACTAQLVSIWFVIGAVVSLIVSIFSTSVTLQIIVFIAVTLLMLFSTRPFVKKLFNFKKEDTNSGRYIGKTGVVVKTINNEIGEGQVNIFGSIWTARSVDDSIIDEGENVKVESIQGVKVLVKKIIITN